MAMTMDFTQHMRAARNGARPLWPVILILGAFTAGAPAQSEDGFLNWIVKSVTADEEGAVIEAALGTPQAGDTLLQGQRISTGPGEQMVLTNGRDLVTLNPGTSVEIGDNDSTTDKANLELKSGTVHVKAGKRTPGHTFSVEAAYLVATVKGTQFDVSTSSEVSAVSVTEGVVGVQAITTHQEIDVTPGKTAIVGRLTTDVPQLVDTPVGGAAGIVGDDTSETASNIDEATGLPTGDLGIGGLGSGGTAESAGGASSDAGGAVGGAVSGASDAVGGAVSGAGDAVGGAVSGATGAVGGAVGGTVGGAVSDVGAAAGGAVSDVGDTVGGAVGDVGGAVGGAVGGLGGGLGGALGGLGRGK